MQNAEIEVQALLDRFKDYVATDYKYDEAPIFECQKQCALIVVDEVLKELEFIKHELLSKTTLLEEIEFWQSVKSHLLKM